MIATMLANVPINVPWTHPIAGSRTLVPGGSASEAAPADTHNPTLTSCSSRQSEHSRYAIIRQSRSYCGSQRNFGDMPLASGPRELDEHIDRRTDVVEHAVAIEARAGLQDKQRNLLDRALGAVRMDGCH